MTATLYDIQITLQPLHDAELVFLDEQSGASIESLVLNVAPFYIGAAGPQGLDGGADRERETIAFVPNQQNYTLTNTLTTTQSLRAKLEISSAPNVIHGQGYSITGSLLTLDINLIACMRAGDIMQVTY